MPYWLTLKLPQSLNVVESPELRSLFRMLREELRESDIPGRTHIRTRVAAIWDEHIAKLERDMTVCSVYCCRNRILTTLL